MYLFMYTIPSVTVCMINEFVFMYGDHYNDTGSGACKKKDEYLGSKYP